MPPKPKPKALENSAGSKGWEQELSLAPFCEAGVWNASIALVVESTVADSEHIAALGSAISTGVRKLFTYISRDDLYKLVTELGGSGAASKGQKGKGKEASQNAEVCEACKSYLDAGEELPLPLLAQLIKFRLLTAKNADQQRRQLEMKSISSKDAIKGGKGDKTAGSKSPPKGGKAAGAGTQKKGQEVSPKTESTLKKRGEAEQEINYINDEPEDGPQLYVVMNGFNHPHLLTFLAEIGIDIDSIIRVESHPMDKNCEPASEEEALKLCSKVKELGHFWRDMLPIMNHAPESSSLHDVARLSYNISHQNITLPSDDPADVKAAIGSAMFDHISVLMYNLSDAKRHWKNYLSSMKLLPIPSIASLAPHLDTNLSSTTLGAADAQSSPVTMVPPLSPTRLAESAGDSDVKIPIPASTRHVDMRYYNELMNSVPLESTSVPLILYSMVEQVCASEENRQPQCEAARELRSDGLDHSLAEHLSNVVFRLSLSDEQRTTLCNDFDVPSNEPACGPQKTLIINHHDEINHRLFHLKNTECLNMVQAELEMLGYTSLCREVFKDLEASGCARASLDRAARLQTLLHFISCQGVFNKDEIAHVMNQFVFECMDLASVDNEGNIEQSQRAAMQYDIPWDDPYPYYCGMISTCSHDAEHSDMSVSSSARQNDDVSTTKLDSTGELGASDRNSMSRSGSILKRNESSGVRRNVSSAHSVKFQGANEDNETGSSDEVIGNWHSSESETHNTPHLDLMTIVNNARKRNLDPWCFAEHMEPTVLLQSMLKTLETHSFVDVYRHRQDHSVLVIMHNPQHEQTNHSHECWQVQLHSNVRFRNYLEHVAVTIVEWIQQEEAKYQASLLAAEVEKLRSEESKSSQQLGDDKSGKNRDRSKSPKKNDKTSRSPSASPERPASASGNPFIRAGSIKAWKEEQERARIEQEAEEKNTEDKKSKSKGSPRQKPGQGEDNAHVGEQSKDKKKSEANKKTSPGDNKQVNTENTVPEEQTETTEEKYWPFVGYEMGSGLVHVSGTVSKMFPSDGGQIHTERIQFVHGTTNVRATLLKDGHMFNVHILDPQRNMTLANEDQCIDAQSQGQDQNIATGSLDNNNEHQAEGDTASGAPIVETRKLSNNKPGVGRFGSFTAQLSDGMMFAVSAYGPDGEPADTKPYEPEPYKIPEPRSPSPVVAKDAGKGKGAKEKGDKKEKEKVSEPIPVVEEVKIEVVESQSKPQAVPVPFQQLYVSCPDGLAVNYYTDSVIEEELPDGCPVSLLIRQSYPLKTRGSQCCEAARRQAMEECSRVITNDGTVIKTLIDGSTQVLFADGTVKELRANSALLPTEFTVLPEPVESTTKIVTSSAFVNKKSRSNTQQSKIDGDVLAAGKLEDAAVNTPGCGIEKERLFWITTLPSGERIAKRCSDGAEICVPKSNVVIMSDPQTSQVMHNRDDHVVSVFYPDGTSVVEHADGTRITCVRKQSQVVELKSQDDGEACTTTTEYVMKLILVECKGFATVRFDSESGLCTTEFGSSGASVDCLPVDGGSYAIFPSSAGSQAFGAKGCLRIDNDGTAVYYPNYWPGLMPTGDSSGSYYIMRHSDDVVMETLDTNGCHYFVTRAGDNHIGIANNTCITLSTKEPDVCDELLEAASQEAPAPEVSSDVELERPPTPMHSGADDEDVTPSNESVEQNSCAAKCTNHIKSYGEHAPRLFVVNSDGGYQLLRQGDISEYLMAAERDTRSVVLTECLPDSANVLCITVLRSGSFNLSDQWLRPYIHDSVIPTGLQTVCTPAKSTSAKESGTVNHRFAASLGKGLDIGVLQSAKNLLSSLPPITLECPPVLEVRQILQFSPVTEQSRLSMEAGLKAYADHVKQQMQCAQDCAVVDPRSSMEQSLANATLTEYLRSQRPLPLEDDIEQLYTKAVANGYVHTPPATPVVPRKKADLEKVRRDLEEEKDCRRALSERLVPPYFNSDIHSLFSSPQQTHDKEALTEQVFGNTSCEQKKSTEEMDRPGLPAVGDNSEAKDELVSDLMSSIDKNESQKDVVVVNEAILPHDDFSEDKSSHTRVNVDSRGGYFIDDVTESHGKTGDTLKCDDTVNKSANSNVAASESRDVLPQDDSQPIQVGDQGSKSDACVIQPTVERVCSGRKGRQTATRGQCDDVTTARGQCDDVATARGQCDDVATARGQCDDVQFTMIPFSGKLAEFMSSKPGELPTFITSLIDCPDNNNSNHNSNNSSDPVISSVQAERLIDQQDISTPLDDNAEVTATYQPASPSPPEVTATYQPASPSPPEVPVAHQPASPQSEAPVAHQPASSPSEVSSAPQPAFSPSEVPVAPQPASSPPEVPVAYQPTSSFSPAQESDSKSLPKVTRHGVCNAAGEPRNEPVKVPPYLLSGGRPGATPNAKFSDVEEPVRRKVNNTSVTAATVNGIETLSHMRGLIVQPAQVDFGVLKEGCTYNFTLKLKNTGIDSCRFRIRQPPPSTGIKVIYTPGPVAAGLKSDIQVEIFAIAAGVKGDRGIGRILHNLQITTETDHLLIPISATVLTASEFESRSPDSPRGFKAPGVKLVSSKPPSGIGAIRPPRRSGDVPESILVN